MKHARMIISRETGIDKDTAPENHIAGMTGIAGMSIACLRQWNSGGPAASFGLLRDRMAAGQAGACFRALQDLADTLGTHMRRPLRCHAPQCCRIGSDEAAFARFVEEAALGAREDALMLASLLVDARGILALTDAAGRFGLCLHRTALCDAQRRMPEPESQTRH